MQRNYKHILLFLFGMVLLPKSLYAQGIDPKFSVEQPTDDLGNVSDAFQENFFEALKQKGIENYELALVALKKAKLAAKKNPENEAVVYFEMGKNQTHLKQYEAAEENFKKVIETQGNKLDVLVAMYDLYYKKKDYNAAIPLVEKLVVFDDDYKEDLANLYLRTQQYDKSLSLLDELDETWGESKYRSALRTRIYKFTGNASGAIEKLEEKVNNNPKQEKDYLNLIYLYSEEGDTQKAFEMAKTLLKNNPKSQLGHLALYKFYLTQGNAQDAINSMKIVFGSQQIDTKNKYKVLGDFIQFVNKNPQHEASLETMTAFFSEENSGKVYEKLGDYYMAKEQKEEALRFYEKGIVNDADNFSLLKNTLLLQIDFKKFEEASLLSTQGLEIFPAQPLLYLLNGVANNGLKKPNVAIENLEMGMDYLLDDPAMEHDFYKQLQLAYTLKGNSKKADEFARKSSEIKYPN